MKQRFVARIRDYIEDDPHAVRGIAGAAALLAGLRAMAGWRLAIATDGWRETALLKLQAAGIDHEGIALASSSDAHPRVEIMRIAAYRALGDLAAQRRTYLGGKVSHDTTFASFADQAMILSVLGMQAGQVACLIARDRRP